MLWYLCFCVEKIKCGGQGSTHKMHLVNKFRNQVCSKRFVRLRTSQLRIHVGDRVRTCEGISHRILSPARLATPAPPHEFNWECRYKRLSDYFCVSSVFAKI